MLRGKSHYYPILGEDTENNCVTSLHNWWRQKCKFSSGSLTQRAHPTGSVAWDSRGGELITAPTSAG